jgi:hypothetical protein
MAKDRNTEVDFNYRFDSKKQKNRFKVYAAKIESSMNELITVALKTVYPKIMNDDKNREKNIGKKAR